jgi:hypothetical protein
MVVTLMNLIAVRITAFIWHEILKFLYEILFIYILFYTHTDTKLDWQAENYMILWPLTFVKVERFLLLL